ncbi:hypothetical protein P4E94_08430 [Pontiellaceae bacterium B12219]|nr:hypothetical protein [Pontiellaceae bacterium B12219]
MKKQIIMPGVVSVLLLSGCTTVKQEYHEKFQNRTVAATGHFADSTIAMLSNLNLQFSPADTVVVRRFVDPAAQPEIHAKELHDDMVEGISAIVWYSVKLVDINQTGRDEAERVAMYGEYLKTFKKRLLEKGRCTETDFDKAVDLVLQQQTLLQALQVAQPLLNTMITDAALQIGELIDSVKVLSDTIDKRIDADYVKIIHYRKTLEQEKFDILEAYELIYEAYRSPSPNLDELRESGVMWDPGIIPEGTPTKKDIKAIAEQLSARLTALRSVQEEIQPDWDEYLMIHVELDRIAQKIIDDAVRTRVLMLTWIRAHQRLAQGTTEAAEWFDITDLGKQLIQDAPKTVLP